MTLSPFSTRRPPTAPPIMPGAITATTGFIYRCLRELASMGLKHSRFRLGKTGRFGFAAMRQAQMPPDVQEPETPRARLPRRSLLRDCARKPHARERGRARRIRPRQSAPPGGARQISAVALALATG